MFIEKFCYVEKVKVNMVYHKLNSNLLQWHIAR